MSLAREKKMKKNTSKKPYILIAIYVMLVIYELLFFVPYHQIQTFVSEQNVPHTEIIGSGYTTIFSISSDTAQVLSHATRSSGKRVNTPQLLINISITTFLAVAIYFLMQKNEKMNNIPELDFESIAFSTEEEVKQAQKDYAIKMYEYVKGKEFL